MKKRLYAFVTVILMIAALPQFALAATITASADPTMMTVQGDARISVTVTNDGETAMENIVISNPYQLLFDTSGAVVNPGESKTFSVTATVPDQLLGVTLSFDLSWTENGEQKSGSTSVVIVRGSKSGVTVNRTASSTNASPGEKVTLTYKVTNTGIVALKKVSLTDSGIAGKTPIFKDITIAAGETYEFPYEFEMGYETVNSAPIVTYTPDGESTPQTSAPIAEIRIGMVNTKLSIEVEQGKSTAEGVTFSILLTNTGNQKLRRISVKDELDNSVTEESISLAVGEGTRLTYKVQTEKERYVAFTVTAATDSGETYENTTESYVVRKFIDPSLLGVDFKAEVLEPLNAAGSIKVKFTFVNTGALVMKDLVLNEQTAQELYRLSELPAGEQSTEQTIYVGEPRDLVFTLNLTDPAGTPYTYTANIKAAYLGDGFLATAATPEPIDETSSDALGSGVGSSVRTALKTTLLVLGILTLAAGIALIVLTVLERKERERIARAKRRRERLLREQQANAGFANNDLTKTQINRRPPTEKL